MGKAWVAREIVTDGKRKREKIEAGTKGVGPNDRFVVGYYDPDGKLRQVGIGIAGKPGKRAADRKVDEITGSLLAGTYHRASDRSWKEFRTEYESKILPRLEPSTQFEIRNAMNHFEELVKPARVSTITTATVDAFTAKRRESKGRKNGSKVSPYTVRKELGHLRAIINVAVDWGCLAKAPKFRMPRVLQEDPPAVTLDHFRAIYDACEVATMPKGLGCDPATWWRGMITYAITTGWRIGEILSFPTTDLDVATGKIVVRAKNAKGKRDGVDYLPEVTLTHVKAVLQPLPVGSEGSDTIPIAEAPALPPVVFPWPHHRRTLDVQFGKIQDAAGIKLKCHAEHEHTDACHRYGFHGFRYAYGTLNADSMPMAVLQRKMRHACPDTTRRYIALADKMKKTSDVVVVPDFLRNTGTDGTKPSGSRS